MIVRIGFVFGVLCVISVLSSSVAHSDMTEKDHMMEKNMEMTSIPPKAMLMGSEDHHASGIAEIIEDEMGKMNLVFSDLKVDKVPDGRVYLAKNGDYGNGVELGKLTRFSGRVMFPIPQGVDPSDFNSVVIWCKKFDVEIGRGTFETAMNENDPSMMDR